MFIILSMLFLMALCYILLMPIVLYINTDTDEYYVKLKGFAKATIESNQEEFIQLRIKFMLRNFYFYPLKNKPSKKRHLEAKSKRKKRLSLATMLRLAKSFRLKILKVNVDYGDCLINANLYPIFFVLNQSVGDFNVNFEGRNQLLLNLQVRPIKIIQKYLNI